MLFDTQLARCWSVLPLLEERLLLIRSAHSGASTLPARLPKRLRLGPHGLHSRIDAAFATAKATLQVTMEIDSLENF